jgi:hypothetical protein
MAIGVAVSEQTREELKAGLMTITNVGLARPRVSFSAASTLALVVAGATLVTAAAGQTSGVRDPKVGTEVTITGCLHAGDEPDSFVLVGVTERPAQGEAAPLVPVPFAIYWLDSTDGLKPLVGQFVDVRGKVVKREAKQGTITVDVHPANVLSDTVEVTTDDDSVKSKKYDGRPQPVGTSGSPSTIVLARPVYKLDVKQVSAAARIGPVGPACR